MGHASDGYNKVIGDEDGGMEISEALKRKDRERAERAGSRRRVRGGAPASASVSRKEDTRELVMGEIQQEALSFAQLLVKLFAFLHNIPRIDLIPFEVGKLREGRVLPIFR